MKTIILCGGRGTRLGEHGVSVPKALIEIGGRPVLWHLMKVYSQCGMNDFILCLGYLGDSIKRYFLEHHWLDNDFSLKLNSGGEPELNRLQRGGEDWRVTFVETGVDTQTGGRLKRVQTYIGKDATFCVTYGDGLANVDLRALLDFHRSHGRVATLTTVHPRSSFGVLKINEQNSVTEFEEKPVMNEWINGGFFVFDREIFDYLDEDCILEREPFQRLASEGQMMAYRHSGFWKCMDTYKDNVEFNQLWDQGQAAWKIWP